MQERRVRARMAHGAWRMAPVLAWPIPVLILVLMLMVMVRQRLSRPGELRYRESV